MPKFISLLSSGLDSPVAAYLMIKKKYTPIFLTFLTFMNENCMMKTQITKIVNILKKYTRNKLKLYIIKHDSNLNLFKQCCERKLTCILCKRLMFRIAKQIAKKENTKIIVTGEILGEQASQTLDNLYAYNDIFKNYIILRPLIGWEKLDVINLNKKIGLYNTISQLSISCQYNPQYPETHAKFLEIKINESKLNISNLIIKSIEDAEILEF